MFLRSIVWRANRLASLMGLVVVAAFGIDMRGDQPARAAAAIPNANYHVVHGWPVLPENSVLNEVSAVAVDSHGNVLVLQRGGRQWPESDVLDQTPIAA